MRIAIYSMILAGIGIMLSNIYRYNIFMQNSIDVLSSGKKPDKIWTGTGLVLLVFFLCGYIGIGISGRADLLVAAILFGGSIFVAIVLTLMFHLIDTVKERSINVAEVLIGVIEARDPNLNGHSRYVQNLTMCLFNHLPSDCKKDISAVSLEYAALLHDVGKLGVPESVLNKPGKLNDEEWELMRQHPRMGVEILRPLKSFTHIMPWIEYHHERIDGNGYYKVPGEKIPFAARLIAVCDTYSAITMKRSYKSPKAHEEAMSIINDVAGTQLDPDLVRIFSEIPKEELLACVPESVEV